MKRVRIAALASVWLVSAVTSTRAVLAMTPAASMTPTCRTAQLKITLWHSFAALGTAGAYIRFTNDSRGTCELHGWPTLIGQPAERRLAGKRARDAAAMDFPDVRTRVGVPKVVLRSGQRADAIFAAPDASVSGARCPAFRRLRVLPPDQTRAVTVSAWIGYLGGFMPSCSVFRVSPILPSTAVYRG